jgi:hypothetical protein
MHHDCVQEECHLILLFGLIRLTMALSKTGGGRTLFGNVANVKADWYSWAAKQVLCIDQTNLMNKLLDEPYRYETLTADRTEDNVKLLLEYLANRTKHLMRQLFNKYKTDSTLQCCIEAVVFGSSSSIIWTCGKNALLLINQ